MIILAGPYGILGMVKFESDDTTDDKGNLKIISHCGFAKNVIIDDDVECICTLPECAKYFIKKGTKDVKVHYYEYIV